jgi:hypothetical protein
MTVINQIGLILYENIFIEMEKNQVKLGFKILMISAVVDGRYDIKEGQVIEKFMQKFAPNSLVADFEDEHKELLEIEKNTHFDFCVEYAKSFDITSSQKEKLELIYYIHEVVYKDGNITDNEKKLLTMIAEVFNENIDFLFEEIEG